MAGQQELDPPFADRLFQFVELFPHGVRVARHGPDGGDTRLHVGVQEVEELVIALLLHVSLAPGCDQAHATDSLAQPVAGHR